MKFKVGDIIRDNRPNRLCLIKSIKLGWYELENLAIHFGRNKTVATPVNYMFSVNEDYLKNHFILYSAILRKEEDL